MRPVDHCERAGEIHRAEAQVPTLLNLLLIPFDEEAFRIEIGALGSRLEPRGARGTNQFMQNGFLVAGQLIPMQKLALRQQTLLFAHDDIMARALAAC